MELELYTGDAKDVLKKMPDESIDCFLVSVPYGSIRKYNGFTFDAASIFPQVVRTLSQGGVVLFNEADQQKDFNLSGETFKHFLQFQELGLLMNQVIIIEKNACPYPSGYGKYNNTHEYLGVFSKGRPKIFNPIIDKKNSQFGKTGKSVSRKGEGETLIKTGKSYTIGEFSKRGSVWKIEVGGGKQYEKGIKINHPAIMNLYDLAIPCLQTWTNKDSTVADFCLGSGTSGVAAKMLGCKKFIGIDISKVYVKETKKRINRTEEGSLR